MLRQHRLGNARHRIGAPVHGHAKGIRERLSFASRQKVDDEVKRWRSDRELTM
jgi:hypothetical protein